MSPVSSAIGMKSAGRHHAELRVVQRSRPSTPAIAPVARVDLRLVVQHEALRCSIAWRRPIPAAGVAARAPFISALKNCSAVAALGLGVVHRHVGIPHQLVDVGAVVGVECDADAAGDVQLGTVHVVWIPHQRDQTGAATMYADLVAVLDAVQQDDELVAAQARSPCRRCARYPSGAARPSAAARRRRGGRASR